MHDLEIHDLEIESSNSRWGGERGISIQNALSLNSKRMNKCSMDDYIYHPKNIEIFFGSRSKTKYAELHQICMKLPTLVDHNFEKHF